MKVLLTSTSYVPAIGGAQLHLHYLARQLLKRHSVEAITLWDVNRTDWLLGTTLRAASTVRDYVVDGVPVQRLGISVGEKARILPAVAGYYLAQGAAIESISSILAEKMMSVARGSDVVQNGRIGREPISYASLKIARKLDVPFFLTPYHHPRWGGWWYRHFIKLYRKADGLITLTNAEKGLLADLGVDPEKIFVTGMGPILAESADGEAFTRRFSLDKPIVLFLGQHYIYKGFRALLEAAPEVWRRIPEVQFVFIGPGVGNSERFFKESRDPRIHRLGIVDLQTKTDALAACDVLCVPSSQESFGGVYTEAWVFGKPVIGCKIPAVREVIDDGVDGYLVEQDPGQIAERICELILSPVLASKIGLAGKNKVEDRFTWEQIASRTEEAYASVLHSRSG